jgi:hypothetical protein
LYRQRWKRHRGKISLAQFARAQERFYPEAEANRKLSRQDHTYPEYLPFSFDLRKEEKEKQRRKKENSSVSFCWANYLLPARVSTLLPFAAVRKEAFALALFRDINF